MRIATFRAPEGTYTVNRTWLAGGKTTVLEIQLDNDLARVRTYAGLLSTTEALRRLQEEKLYPGPLNRAYTDQ